MKFLDLLSSDQLLAATGAHTHTRPASSTASASSSSLSVPTSFADLALTDGQRVPGTQWGFVPTTDDEFSYKR